MKRVALFVTLAAALTSACKSTQDGAAPVGSGTSTAASGSSTGNAAASGSAGATAAIAEPPAAPSVVGSAAAAPTAASDSAKPGVLGRPLLWSAEKDGKATYLFGTMHMGVDAETQLPPLVWTKLHDAKSFAMEADINDPQVMTAMITPSKTSLRAELGPDYWKKLEAAIGETMANALDKMQPMVAGALVAIRGLPPTEPMDKALSNRAKAETKPVVYLEPGLFQIEMLRKWMDVKALKLLLDDLAKTEERSQSMLAAYVSGDERRIIAINDSEKADALAHGYSKAEYDQQMNEMLYNRNASWIAAIEKLHAEGGGFVAVGVLHLVGSRSVTELLAKKGYKITRVVP